MDKDHRLDAPDNEELSTIEQIDNHSELTTLYPHVHHEWEGADLLSSDERTRKHDEEQLRISMTIRKWFPIIGLLVPIPAFLIAFSAIIAPRFLKPDDMGILLLPVLGIVALIGWLSFRSIQQVYIIFYNHAIKATPFLVVLIGYLLLSLFSLFIVTQPLHTGDYFIDAMIISGVVWGASIVYSAILVFIWSSRRLGARAKLWLIAGIAAALLAIGTTLYLL